MAAKNIIAEAGGTIKVIGSRIATPFIDPKPGMAPMNKPIVTPTTITARFSGWNEIAKPFNRRSSVSIFENAL